MSSLIIQSGKLKGKQLLLPDREIVIGRDEGCHVRLASSLVSRQHCSLRDSREGVWVRDLGSQNGTFVNDVAIEEPTLLKAGDVLRVGVTEFRAAGMKTDTAPLLARPAAPGEQLSDDEIAGWLSDDELPAASSDSSDTAIAGQESEPTSEVSTEPSAPAAKSKKFKSIAEEAAEIIRRHWAAQGAEPPAKNS